MLAVNTTVARPLPADPADPADAAVENINVEPPVVNYYSSTPTCKSQPSNIMTLR